MWSENSVQNESSESISRVEVKLTRFITLVGRSMHSGHTETKVIRDVMHGQSFEGVPANTSFTDQNAKYMPLSLPLVLTPDTNSQNVACRHEIDVVFVPGKHWKVYKALPALSMFSLSRE